jgi:hypothetical protein
MAGRYNKPVQCGRESAHKSRAARGKATLGVCMRRTQHLLGDIGDLQQGLGEVSCCGLCRAKQFRPLVSCLSTRIASYRRWRSKGVGQLRVGLLALDSRSVKLAGGLPSGSILSGPNNTTLFYIFVGQAKTEKNRHVQCLITFTDTQLIFPNTRIKKQVKLKNKGCKVNNEFLC